MAEADQVAGNPAVYRSGQEIECWLTDMDGVLVHENQAVPGAAELIQRWVDTSKRFLVLTNNSIFTPRDLAARLRASGLEVPEENIWTSALATAQFLKNQVEGSGSGNRAYTIGEAGLTTALHEAGFILTDQDPDFVVLGETRTYSFEAITMAIRLILGGARFIATNPDATGPSADGALPATGSVAALIRHATGVTRNLAPRHSTSSPTRPAAQTPKAIRSRTGASQKYRASARSFNPYTPTAKRGMSRARIVTANNHNAKPEKPQANVAASAVATP